MWRTLITCFTLVCFIITLPGCHSSTVVSREAVPQDATDISEIVTTAGEVYEFIGDGRGNFAKLRDSTVVGTLQGGRKVSIPMSQVTRISVMRIDPVKTIVWTVGGIAITALVVVAIIAATKQSCPFVYSYDGEKYMFDGEPYGGAICEGMKRMDWARLKYLKAVDGKYRLLLTNEVDETQFTDEFKLWIIDHRPDEDVSLDATGHVYTVAQRLKPMRIMGNHGRDLMLWLGENDKLVWESDMSSRTPANPGNLRDSLRMTFSKPRGARSAKLVVSGGTTLWGSQMLKRMTQLRGEKIPQWYEDMKSVENRNLLDAWNLREELYHLQVRVRVGEEWVPRGEILGGGPFITEERVVPLDLQGVEGETVNILLTPAVGFWQFNSFAFDYTENPPVAVQEIGADTITGDDGEDLLNALSATDSKYYAAPRKGQSASLVFAAPVAKSGTRRTVFAKASGYYEMHMNASGAPRTDILYRIAAEPGYPTSFAIEEYWKWKSELMQAGTTGTEGSR